MSTPTRSGGLGAALGLSASVAMLGYRRGALSRSGAGGAVLVGSSVYRAGGWRWSAVLLTFFTGSSALSRLETRGPGGAAIAAMSARGARRDLTQALANGGVATVAALAHLARPSERLADAFAGALAAANADTWATEIGGLSHAAPRLVTTGRPVPAGASGGVTPHGLLGAAAGSALIAAVAALALEPRPSWRRAARIATAGLAGSLVDSLAGATIQAAYRCPRCEAPTERRIHRCGTQTVLVRGYPWSSNDVVNVLCTAAGALSAQRRP